MVLALVLALVSVQVLALVPTSTSRLTASSQLDVLLASRLSSPASALVFAADFKVVPAFALLSRLR